MPDLSRRKCLMLTPTSPRSPIPSPAQVHRATMLVEGQPQVVAVKVRHPSVSLRIWQVGRATQRASWQLFWLRANWFFPPLLVCVVAGVVGCRASWQLFWPSVNWLWPWLICVMDRSLVVVARWQWHACLLHPLQDFQLLRPLAALTGRIRTLRVRTAEAGHVLVRMPGGRGQHWVLWHASPSHRPHVPCLAFPCALQSLHLSDSVAQFSHTMTAQVGGAARVASERKALRAWCSTRGSIDEGAQVLHGGV